MAQSQSQTLTRREHPLIVVFTGDLVASSKLAPEALAEAMHAVEHAFEDLVRAWGSGAPRFTRFEGGHAAGARLPPEWGPRFSAFRGDGWQCVGYQPALALRTALFVRARLGSLGRAFDTRVSVGVGRGWLTEDSDLNLASGPAFELSGRGLDALPHARRFAVAWDERPAAAPLVDAIFALADEISRNWTPGQARVFAQALLERPRPNQAALARALDVTQQAVASHLAGGGDWALQEALRAVEGGE